MASNLPEDFKELEEITKNFENYQRKSTKMSKKFTEIESKFRKTFKSIRSKMAPDESKYLKWTSEDVVKSVILCSISLFGVRELNK